MKFDIDILRVYTDLQRLVNVIHKKEEPKQIELFRLKEFKNMDECKNFIFKTFDTDKVITENENECMIEVWKQYQNNEPYYKDVINITRVYSINVIDNNVCILSTLGHGVYDINTKKYPYLENKIIDKIVSKRKDYIEVYIK